MRDNGKLVIDLGGVFISFKQVSQLVYVNLKYLTDDFSNTLHPVIVS